MFTYPFFDLDGNLTDSAEGIINSVLYTLKKWGSTNLTARSRKDLSFPRC